MERPSRAQHGLLNADLSGSSPFLMMLKPVPSSFTLARSLIQAGLPRRDWNAIHLPSGDHTGSRHWSLGISFRIVILPEAMSSTVICLLGSSAPLATFSVEAQSRQAGAR